MAVVLATLGGAAVVAPAPAFAGTPPSCVVTTILNFNHVQVDNRCGARSSYWIKVIWKNSPDSDCFFLGPFAGADRRARLPTG